MTISEYVAINNLKGVQNFASKSGYEIPNDSREAYLLLKMIDNTNPEQALKILSALHPDKFLFKSQEVAQVLAAPVVTSAPVEEKTKNFNNMSDCGCMKNATGDFGTGMSVESLTNQGIAYTENAVNAGVDKIRQAVKEKNDDLVRNLLFFGAGFVVCKLLFK